MNRDHLPLWAQIILDDQRPAASALTAARRKDPAQEKPVSDAHSRRTSQSRAVSQDCLVLIAHGSKDARWRGTFECLYASVQARYGENIRLAYMEFVGPTMLDIARECYSRGVRSLRVLPLFMAGGAHVATDIPEQMAQVREEFPAMTVEAAAPIGEDPRMFAVIQEIIGDYAHPDAPKFTAA